jgi:hypothetical protein
MASALGSTSKEGMGLEDFYSRDRKFKEFDENYFEQVKFSLQNLKRDLPVHDIRRYFYLFEGKNSAVIRKFKSEVSELKAQNAFFAGFEYHFGGPFFQELKNVLGLEQMALLGSEIYDQQEDDEDEGEELSAAERAEYYALTEMERANF